jgi:hypothetical protein
MTDFKVAWGGEIAELGNPRQRENWRVGGVGERLRGGGEEWSPGETGQKRWGQGLPWRVIGR